MSTEQIRKMIDEFAQLGTVEDSDGELPLIVPYCAELVRTTIEKLEHVDKAVRAICTFVDPAIAVLDDPRQDCEKFNGIRRFRYKSHFLWAFTHLTEALAFHSVLTYSSADATGNKTNLELRATKINSQSLTGPEQYPSFISSETSFILKIFPAIEEKICGMFPFSNKLKG